MPARSRSTGRRYSTRRACRSRATTPEFTPFHRGGSGPPLLLLHGFFDTWRVWEPVLPALEREREVLALTLPGHAGGPPLPAEITEHTVADAVERAMVEAGFELAQIAGNSLGGYVALQLAERGRASRVVAFAPAGGWETDPGVFALQREMHDAFKRVPAYLDARAAGAAATDAPRMLAFAEHARWEVDPERISCPVRIVWGTEDPLLPWPAAAARYRRAFPHADWIELDGVGHCPQVDVPLEAAQLIL